MKVRCISSPSNPIDILYIAGRICKNKSLDDVLDEINNKTEKEKEEFVKKLIKLGHESILEHIYYTFVVEDISRIATHQLVRHRMASYSQFSHRKFDQEVTFIVPGSIETKMNEDEKFNDLLTRFLNQSYVMYASLIDMGVPPEDARFVLPNGLSSTIMFTMNGREIRHFLKLRLSKGAQWEIRNLANEVFDIVEDNCPVLIQGIKEEEK